MEFWGAEVKPGEPLKVQPQLGKVIHISQTALGEVKDVKGAKYVPLRLKIDGKSFILGALSAEERTQMMLDLVFEREFELSHDWKNGSVYYMGYTADDPVSDSEDEFEEKPVAIENGKHKQNAGDMKAEKRAAAAKAVSKKEEQPASDEDEDDSDFDSDDDKAFSKSMLENFSDDSEEDSEDVSDGSFSSEEEPPNKAQPTKKRAAGSAPEAPVSNKKSKPSAPPITGNKKGHNAAPLPSKQAGKGEVGNKSKGKNKKAGGGMSRK